MYLFKYSKRGIAYLSLAESVYDKEKKRSVRKTVRSLGRYDVFAKEHPDELKELEEKYGANRTKDQIEKEADLKEFLALSDSPLSVMQSHNSRIVTQHLAHLFLRKIWNEDLLMSRFSAT